MCCCDKPNINGESGYSWDGKSSGIRPVSPPELGEGESILFDEPGRCGGQDSHSYHYRLVNAQYGGVNLLVQHGGGMECIPRIPNEKAVIEAMRSLDTNGRYWILNALFHAQKESGRKATDDCNGRWRKAAADKKIKTRKERCGSGVKVWIED